MDPLQPNAGVEAIVCPIRPGREKRKDRRARRVALEIERLRIPCAGKPCRRVKKKWPGYYLGIAVQLRARLCYECWLERQGVAPADDAEMEEEKRLLRNEPVRYGAIWVGTQARRKE